MLRLILCLAAVAAAFAQPSSEFWPGARYDPAIPTYEKVLGYKPGSVITPCSGLLQYAEALAAAAPARAKVAEYARSWQGRRLVYMVVGSESNMRRLKEVQAGMRRLADPRATPEAEAQKLIASLPALVWIAAGVHGDEISSPEAALFLAYHLLASRGDKMVEQILANTLVFIVPSQNPDGRDRFVNHYVQSLGIEPDPNPMALEHTQPFPGGRFNHYHFDMNRDWMALTQPEIRGQAKALLEWFPLVYVDLHEMGADTTYFFAPEAKPYNPHLTAEQKSSLEWFGKNNAKWFDQFGFNYFTREIYDAFYPGYGASWPSYFGAIAMTYEQASARGLVMRRIDETLLEFRETIRHHFVASLSTCETAAARRRELLENFYRYRKSAIEEGKSEPVREYVLPRRGDTAVVDKLAVLLADQGVEVRRSKSGFQAAGKEVPPGSYAISLAQPSKRLIRTLLDPHVPMSEEFLKEQERRRKRKLPDEIYDVTGWSLPLLYNVELVASAEPVTGDFEVVKPGSPLTGSVAGGKATVAYLVPWGVAGARFLTAALRAGLKVHTADKAFTQNKRKYPRGTLIVRVAENTADLSDKVSRIAKESGAEVVAANTGWVDDGINFGSRHVFPMRRPTVAIAWDRPVAPGSSGHARFVLERQFGYPATAIRIQNLPTADLSRFQVIILPDGQAEGYSTAIGANGARKLKDWVAAGGTLIGIGSANIYLADPRTGLLSIAPENAVKDAPAAPARKPDAAPAAPSAQPPAAAAAAPSPADIRVAGRILAKPEDYLKAIEAEREPPDAAPGVLLRARTDPEHWITAGAPETVIAMVSGRNIFTPIKLDKGVNAAYFLGPGELLASGYLWEENRKQLAYKPLVAVQREGRGAVVAFTADPNFRAYLDSMNLLFLNAVFRGPAVLRPPAGEE